MSGRTWNLPGNFVKAFSLAQWKKWLVTDFQRESDDIERVLTIVESLERIQISLRLAERHGADTDVPEGARYIKISHTMVHELWNNIGEARNLIQSELIE